MFRNNFLADERLQTDHLPARNRARRFAHIELTGISMKTNSVHRIAVIPGDGIGKEVVPEGVRVLEAAAKKFGFELRLENFDFASCDYYEKYGRMMPEDWKDQVGNKEQLYFGRVGMPDRVPD